MEHQQTLAPTILVILIAVFFCLVSLVADLGGLPITLTVILLGVILAALCGTPMEEPHE